MQLGQLLKPFIKKLQDGGPVNPNRFDDISGLSEDDMATYLRTNFGVMDADEYTEYFDPYDTTGEEQLGRQHALGVKSAQTGARNQMGDIYGKARSAGSKGGGFGGRGRAMKAAKGKTLGALQQQKTKLGETLEQGIYGEREKYVDDFMGQVGRLGSMGATFDEDKGTGEGWQSVHSITNQGDCLSADAIWDESTNSCREDMHDEGGPGGTGNTNEVDCNNQGGTWTGSYCQMGSGRG
tara:strand:- start:2858 stop:3571 length:714 start_codon:yes stop_codon:yes gene_type:complete